MRKRVCQVVTIVLFFAILLTGIGYETKVEKKQGFFAATKETEQTSLEKLEYMAVEKPYLQTPDVQKIVASFGADNTVISKAEIAYENTTAKTEGSIEAAQITKEGVVFEIPYSDEKEAGIYKIKSLTYTTEKDSQVLVLKNIGMDITYGVEKQADTEPDAVVAAEEDPQTEMSIVSFDENGIQKSESSIEEAIVNAEQEVEKEQDGLGVARFSSNGNVVVVLDPGHDATHSGAHSETPSGKLEEAEVNLQIALACREELQQYSGVEVYMTRETASCPYPGTSSGDDNANRVAYAASVGANVYVSIHCNSSSNSNAKGVEVYYPNSNYNAAVGQAGSELADQALDQLVSLGLANRGTHIRNSESNTTYPDGSLADYYGVIRKSKLAGFPGIIIEHGFLSNDSDVNNFLESNEGRRRLGVADATAIANYYNLSQGSDTVYQGVDYSAVYDKDYYGRYADLAGYNGNARLLLKHFVEHGMSEGRQGNSIFQVQYYQSRYGDLRNGFGSDLKQYYMHFLQNGIYEGRQGSAAFDVFSYINRYADLRQGFGNNLKAYYMHYVTSGEKEGRIATDCPTMQNVAVVYNGINYSAVYNYEYYKACYPDIANGYGFDDYAILDHFVNHGMSEGRQGSAEFNVYSYRNQYGDLRRAFGNNLQSYYLHYVTNGKAEGRTGTGCNTVQGILTVYNGVDYSAVYDYSYYTSTQTDIARAYGGDETAVLAHFVNHGMSEGRQGNVQFNVYSYRNQYSDLRQAYGNDLKLYYLHYVNNGKSEGRQGVGCSVLQNPTTVYNGVDYSAVYNYDYYTKAYGDIASAYGGDETAVIAHFVNHGMSEGRQGSPEFYIYSYKSKYADLANAFGNDLKSYYMHYVNNGKSEGRTGV